MNPTSKKLISLFLVFSLMMLSANLYAKERRGATIIIQRIGDQVRQVKKTLEGTPWEITGIRGELIAVKPNSLLLLNTNGKDVSVDIADIKVIIIVKKSKALLGAGVGFLIGGVRGTLAGIRYEDPIDYSVVVAFGVGFGVVCMVIGAVLGAVLGTDKTIHFEGMTDTEIQETLEYLRKKARIRDYK